ncbi:MAG: S-layer homology domain-containing protein, partial [Defluviitaleaceae bacterium]|nr:S-layer homology domain-containing protein [Defluviitaleaceae bacterium]
LVNGIGDGSFAPHRPITREEMAVLLHRYIKDIALPTGLALPFTDQAHISPWAVYAVMEIKAAGIITGHPDGSFAPQASATRADAAAIFSRFLISK